MANWKKVIVSGSAAELLQVTASTADITTLNVTAGSGSFSGSFQGDGAGLTNVPATGIVLASLTDGAGITTFSYNGQTTQSVAVGAGLGITVNADDVELNTGSAHFTAGVRGKISVVDNAGDGSLTYNSSTGVLTYAGVTSGSVRGYFTASDTTGPSGIDMAYDPSTGTFSGSLVNSNIVVTDGTTPSNIDLGGTLTFSNVTNETTVTQAGGTVTIGLPDSVTITNDLTVSRDLVVSRNLTVAGTASFQHTENLDVADRFILLASGSNTGGDGGIVIQQGTQGIGEAFGYDNAVTRWGVTGSFDGSQATFAPDAFMAAVVVGSGTNPNDAPGRYDKAGNLFVGSDGEIYIYS